MMGQKGRINDLGIKTRYTGNFGNYNETIVVPIPYYISTKQISPYIYITITTHCALVYYQRRFCSIA